MKKTYLKVFISLFCVILFIMPITAIENTRVKEEYISNVDLLDGSWIKEINGVNVIHLNGSNYNMGYQHGYLLGEQISENLRCYLSYYERYGWSYNQIIEVWNIMDDYVPQNYIEEMHGMANGSGLSFDDIVIINMFPDLYNIFNKSCFAGAIWGNATIDGSLYHIRSFDWDLNTVDPETGKHIQENIIIIVRNPDDGYASLSPDFAGNICTWNGFNEKSISISETTVHAYDTTFYGIPVTFRMRMVLDYASTGDEAIEIIANNRTCGSNFVISDGKIPKGYALDQTASCSYVGGWDDPVEGTRPFWQINDVVRRAPMFISPDCAEKEQNRIRYNPSGFLSFLWTLPQIPPYTLIWVLWTHYRAFSNIIETRYGTFDLNTTMAAVRYHYNGNTDFRMKYCVIFKYWSPMFQYIACPETGEIVISIASKDVMAHKNSIPINYFDIDNLLNSPPNK
jgi:hypothetical protein